jgi:hypothetical protein
LDDLDRLEAKTWHLEGELALTRCRRIKLTKSRNDEKEGQRKREVDRLFWQRG